MASKAKRTHLSAVLLALEIELMRNPSLLRSQWDISIMQSLTGFFLNHPSDFLFSLAPYPLMAESEELKSLLINVKEESEKAGLKLNIQKSKIMASGPITSCQVDGETMETVTDFIFLDSKITADGDCSHKIKRCLLLGRKTMANLDNILKSRDITFPTKVHLVKAMVFPVVMYVCESWTI